MAGVTDRPFRNLCRSLGAEFAICEMVGSDDRLWQTTKSQRRLRHAHGEEPRWIQIVGADANMMAAAARRCMAKGAQIIDINMGCPAKKVCKRAAGSALMKDEKLVADILQSVVEAVDVPVTVKMRTGWSERSRNVVRIAGIAEQCGVAAITVHGRTGDAGFKGAAEYDSIAAVKQSVTIPVIANGDIDSPEKALSVLAHTGADGVMVGRAAQGKPWIIGEIDSFLSSGKKKRPLRPIEVRDHLLRHLRELHRFYGEASGVRIARKHVGWYLQEQPGAQEKRRAFNGLVAAKDQLTFLDGCFARFITEGDMAA
jgi:tRNA-dihydrouridine synthase B|tara:strand:+ start:966 stop:1904 length:939 start_codon:yes stop_codon:yes gene_type:complete